MMCDVRQDKSAPPNVTEWYYFTSRLQRLEPASGANFTTHVQPLGDLLLSDGALTASRAICQRFARAW